MYSKSDHLSGISPFPPRSRSSAPNQLFSPTFLDQHEFTAHYFYFAEQFKDCPALFSTGILFGLVFVRR
jgi:hypothetical protein